MIDRDLDRSLGQIAFDEPIVLASVSPKHDTHALLVASGAFSVSILAADQLAEGQYFSYPGCRFRYAAEEYVEDWDGLAVVGRSISWLRCAVERTMAAKEYGGDHDLFFARVTGVREGRLKEPPLVYSSRHGWRVTGAPARGKGISVRDALLARLGEEP